MVDEDIVKVHEAMAKLRGPNGQSLRVHVARAACQPTVIVIEPAMASAAVDVKDVQGLDVDKLSILLSERINEAGWWPA